MQSSIERYRCYRCRVNMRHAGIYAAHKPGLERLNGRELVLEAAWLIDDLQLYLGEFAMRELHGTHLLLEEFGITWIASGDLEILEALPTL